MMAKNVIIALDFMGELAALNFLEKFGHIRPYVKVGMELFYAEGPRLVRILKNRGHEVFLDLKLHDIPNTVKGGMRALSKLGADMVNLHAAGGSVMMKAAIAGLTRQDGTRPLLIAVTQLTSTSQIQMQRELLISGSLENAVVSYAKNAAACGLDGVVCSPLEGSMVKDACGQEFLAVTPGIRFAGSAKDDQARITTPAKARALGSDYIVVGRPITAEDHPLKAYERCVEEFMGGRPE